MMKSEVKRDELKSCYGSKVIRQNMKNKSLNILRCSTQTYFTRCSANGLGNFGVQVCALNDVVSIHPEICGGSSIFKFFLMPDELAHLTYF
jgi:hypothetical protein